MNLDLVTAGESHGPALVAIVTGLPAGLTVDRAAIDDDLGRRREGYGRSPRQQLEADEVEVLAGLRHGATLGTPLAIVIRNRDHKNWEWGMSPWPPEGDPAGKGTTPVTLPRPGHADLAGVLKLSENIDAATLASQLIEPVGPYPLLHKGLADKAYEIAMVHPAHLSIAGDEGVGL